MLLMQPAVCNSRNQQFGTQANQQYSNKEISSMLTMQVKQQHINKATQTIKTNHATPTIRSTLTIQPKHSAVSDPRKHQHQTMGPHPTFYIFRLSISLLSNTKTKFKNELKKTVQDRKVCNMHMVSWSKDHCASITQIDHYNNTMNCSEKGRKSRQSHWERKVEDIKGQVWLFCPRCLKNFQRC